MTEVALVQFRTIGFPGNPGFTTLAGVLADGADPAPFVTAARTFMSDVSQVFPTLWSASVEPTVSIVSEGSGALVRYYTPTAAQRAPIQGILGNSFGAGVAGAVVGWTTGEVVRARRVRGRTFLVPLSNQAYESDGTLLFTVITALQDAAQIFINSASGLAIYARPRLGVGGIAAVVLSARVNDKAAYLSSRRD